jgi:catechol 2,3-dioxygenase-like lactoylglutathione lyase family enzyme
MGMNLIQGGAVTIMVADVDRAVRFYTQGLGLALRARRDRDSAEVEAPGLTLTLQRSDRPPRATPLPLQLSIGFDVERLEGAMLVLRERGVQFAPEVAEDERVRIAYFADEDGTALFLRERKRGA